MLSCFFRSPFHTTCYHSFSLIIALYFLFRPPLYFHSSIPHCSSDFSGFFSSPPNRALSLKFLFPTKLPFMPPASLLSALLLLSLLSPSSLLSVDPQFPFLFCCSFFPSSLPHFPPTTTMHSVFISLPCSILSILFTS